jgi:hypothetical protein
MNLRYTIYDLRAAIANERRVNIFAARQSHILNRKFDSTAKE